MVKDRREGTQKGFILLGMVISVPMMLILLVSLGMVVFWGLHNYLYFLADAELQQEVQISFQRVVDDMMEAREIRPLSGYREGYTLTKKLPAGIENSSEKPVRGECHCLREEPRHRDRRISPSWRPSSPAHR